MPVSLLACHCARNLLLVNHNQASEQDLDLLELWFGLLGSAAILWQVPDGQKNSKSQNPSTPQTCTLFFNPIPKYCFVTSAFSSIILLHMFHSSCIHLTFWIFQSIALESRASLWNRIYSEKNEFFFLPTSRKVLSTFQTCCQVQASWGPGCPDGSSFVHFQVQTRKRPENLLTRNPASE